MDTEQPEDKRQEQGDVSQGSPQPKKYLPFSKLKTPAPWPEEMKGFDGVVSDDGKYVAVMHSVRFGGAGFSDEFLTEEEKYQDFGALAQFAALVALGTRKSASKYSAPTIGWIPIELADMYWISCYDGNEAILQCPKKMSKRLTGLEHLSKEEILAVIKPLSQPWVVLSHEQVTGDKNLCKAQSRRWWS